MIARPVGATTSIWLAAAGLALAAGTAAASGHDRGVIEAVVDHSGTVESVKLLKTSGDRKLDDKALKQYQAASFPVPATYATDQHQFSLLLPVRPVKSAD